MYMWKKPFDPPSGLDPIDPRHFHIHDNDVRSESKGHLNGGLPVSCLTDDGQCCVV